MTRNNIGGVYQLKGDYATALSNYEKALEMWQKTLPPNHPNLAIAYHNMAYMHQSLGNYSTALCYYEKTLEIQKKSLPPYHPDIVRTHTNIASLNQLNEDYLSQASNFDVFSSLKSFAEMQQKLIPSDGSDVTVTDENIAEANEFMEKSLNMIVNLEKVLEFKKKYPSVHRLLDPGIQVNSVDENQMIEHLMTMVSQLKKGLGIQQTTSSFANEEANFNDDEMPPSMDHFSLALSSCQKVSEILQKYRPPNDVSLSTNYNNIGQTYYSFGDYVNALSLFEKALDNLQKCSPINQQLLAKTYNNIAKALEGLGRYKDAADYAKQAFEIAHSTVGSNHPETEAYRNQFDQLRPKL
jgi:tetratricopeptide (TPR) repeat protein